MRNQIDDHGSVNVYVPTQEYLDSDVINVFVPPLVVLPNTTEYVSVARAQLGPNGMPGQAYHLAVTASPDNPEFEVLFGWQFDPKPNGPSIDMVFSEAGETLTFFVAAKRRRDHSTGDPLVATFAWGVIQAP